MKIKVREKSTPSIVAQGQRRLVQNAEQQVQSASLAFSISSNKTKSLHLFSVVLV